MTSVPMNLVYLMTSSLMRMRDTRTAHPLLEAGPVTEVLRWRETAVRR